MVLNIASFSRNVFLFLISSRCCCYCCQYYHHIIIILGLIAASIIIIIMYIFKSSFRFMLTDLFSLVIASVCVSFSTRARLVIGLRAGKRARK
jgi:hypothetical protein